MKQHILLFSISLLLACSCSSNDESMTDMSDDMQGQMDEPARTTIADAAFEASLVALNLDDVVDGSVLTNNIDNVTSLVLNEQGISSLVGIEDFTDLENLWANGNSLSALNVSQNTKLKFIFVDNNAITEISTSNLPDLEKLSIINNALTAVNVMSNFELQILDVAQNELTAIDISANSALTTFSVVDNPLTCIKVSAAQVENIPDTWQADPEDTYSVNCS